MFGVIKLEIVSDFLQSNLNFICNKGILILNAKKIDMQTHNVFSYEKCINVKILSFIFVLKDLDR